MTAITTGVHLISPNNERKNYYLTQANDGLIRSKHSQSPIKKNSDSLVCLKSVKNKPNKFKIIFPNSGTVLCRDHYNQKIMACDTDVDSEYIEWKISNLGQELYLIKYKDKCISEINQQSGISGHMVRLLKCLTKKQKDGKQNTNVWKITKPSISNKDLPNCDKYNKDQNVESVPDKESDDKFEDPLDNRPNKPLDELQAPKFKLQLVFGDHEPNERLGETIKDENGKYERDSKESYSEESENSEDKKDDNEDIAERMKKENGSDLLKIHGPTPESQDIVPPYSGKIQGPSLALRANDPLPYLGEENQPNLWSPEPVKNIPLYDHTFNQRPKQQAICRDKKTGKTYKYDKLMPYDQALADQQAKVNGEDGFVNSLVDQNLPHHEQAVDMSTQIQKLNPQKDTKPVCSLGNSACLYLLRTPRK